VNEIVFHVHARSRAAKTSGEVRYASKEVVLESGFLLQMQRNCTGIDGT